MKRWKDPFVWVIAVWSVATILMLIYIAEGTRLNWLWWPIGILILVGIVIYQLSGGPQVFWYYKKLNKKEDEDERKK